MLSAFVNVNFYRDSLVCRESWVHKHLMKYLFGDPALPGVLYFPDIIALARMFSVVLRRQICRSCVIIGRM